MADTEAQFLSFIDHCVKDDPSLVVPADKDQPERFAKILVVVRHGIKQYSEALSQLS
jgi:hypothetical protein